MIPIEALPRRRGSPRFPKGLHREVHRLLRGGIPVPVIAAQFNRTEAAIRYHTIQCAAVDARFETDHGEEPIIVPDVEPKKTGGTRKMPKGGRLTETQKQEIRHKLARGDRPSVLAREYDVTEAAIRRYKSGAPHAPNPGAQTGDLDAPPAITEPTPDSVAESLNRVEWDRLPGGASALSPEEVAERIIADAPADPVEQATHRALGADEALMPSPAPSDADPATEALTRVSDQLSQRLHTARLELNRYQILVGRLEDDLHAVQRSLRLVAESHDI